MPVLDVFQGTNINSRKGLQSITIEWSVRGCINTGQFLVALHRGRAGIKASLL